VTFQSVTISARALVSMKVSSIPIAIAAKRFMKRSLSGLVITKIFQAADRANPCAAC
jgi:hypothetical protein